MHAHPLTTPKAGHLLRPAAVPADCTLAGAPASVTATAGTNAATATWTAANGNGSPILGYLVTAAATGIAREVNQAARTVTLTGLPGGAATTLRVQGVTACGSGAAATSAAVTPTGAATTYASKVAAGRPSVYYRLGEASGTKYAADSSANATAAGYDRDAYLGDPGALGPADPDTAAATGTDCCIATASPTLPLGSSPRSVEAWVEPAYNQPSWFAGWGGAGTDQGFDVGVQGQNVLVDAYGDAVSIRAGRGLTDRVWHDVVVTASGQTVSAYVDGTLIGTRTFAGTPATAAGPLVLGGYQNGGSGCSCDLDEVAIYPQVLTPGTVATHFAASGIRPPDAPAGVTASDAGGNEADVSWAADTTATPAVSRYTVTAVSGAGVRSLSTAVDADTTSAHITGLLPGRYTFAVAADNGYGPGAAASSPPITVTGSASPYAGTLNAGRPSAYYRLGEPYSVPVGEDSSGRDAPLDYPDYGNFRGDDGALLPADPDTAVLEPSAVAYAAAVPLDDAARTVEFWVKPDNYDPNGFAGWVLGYGGDGADAAFDVGVGDHDVHVDAGGDAVSIPTGRTILDGAYHQVAISYDGIAVTAYLDGRRLGSAAFAHPLATADVSGLVIGTDHDDFAGRDLFYGDLDEVSIFPRALPAATVQAQFAASGHSVPAAVTGVSATAGTNQAGVTWTPTAGNDPVTSYLVTAVRGGNTLNSKAEPAGATSATLTGLPAGVAVSVRVTAVDAYGDGTPATSSPVTPTGTPTTYASTVLGDHPSAYYRFGEPAGTPIAADSSGSSPPLEVGGTGPGPRGSTTLGIPGAIVGDPDTALGDQGAAPAASAAADLPGGNAPRTVEMWVKPSDDNRVQWLLHWGGSATDTGFDIGVQDTAIRVSGSLDDLSFAVGHPLVDGLWHHVVVSYDGSTVHVYVDGLPLVAKSFAHPLSTTANTELQVGPRLPNGDLYSGGVDELAVYPAALSATAAVAHYSASGHGRPGAVGSLTATPRANALAVSWTAPATGDAPTDYLVTALRGGTIAANAEDVPGAKTSLVLTGLPGGASYRVRVVASNGFGTGDAATTATPVTTTGTPTTYASGVLSDHPSAYYRLGEPAGAPRAADSSGHAANGTYGAVNLGTGGALGGDPDTAAGSGLNNVGFASAPARVPSGNAARTVEAWVRPAPETSQGFPDYTVAGWGQPDNDFEVNAAPSEVDVTANRQYLRFPTGSSLADGAWHHLAVSYDGTSVRCYLDGAPLDAAQSFGSAVSTPASGRLYIGSSPSVGEAYYGSLDEVAVYPAALSAARIAAHFRAAGHRVPGAPGAVSATSLANGVAVTWTAPAATPDAVTHYLISAIAGGRVHSAKAVVAKARSATLTGLPGGVPVTVRVVADNAYGAGAPGVSAAVTPSGPAATYASSVLAQSPVAYYRLGEAPGVDVAADSSGRAGVLDLVGGTLGKSGAIAGDPDTGADIERGCCLGTAAADLPAGAAPRSVEAWVKPSLTDYYNVFAGWGLGDYAFEVATRSDGIEIIAGDDSLIFDAGRRLDDGAWHHVVVTVDGTSATAYLDGRSLGTQSLTSALDTLSGTDLTIGGESRSQFLPFYGGVDEVAVYPAVLTSAQVAAHFRASGHAPAGTPTAVTASAGTQAVAVQWTPPAAAADPVSDYLVTAYQGTIRVGSVAVPGTATSATISGLAGGAPVTARVVAQDPYGSSAPAVSGTATPGGTGTTYAQSVLADHPVGYYRLGDGAGSPAGAEVTGRSGSLVLDAGSGTLGGPGALPDDPDTSLHTGANDYYVGSARAPALPAGDAPRTVEAWIRTTDTSQHAVVGWGSLYEDGAGFQLGVYRSSVLVYGGRSDAADDDDLTIPVGHPLNDGVWHQVAVSYRYGVAHVYVDGVAVAARAFPLALHTVSGTDLQLHGGTGAADLDEVSIYPSQLSAARISAHYAAR